MAKIGYFEKNNEIYIVDFTLQSFERNNKELIMDIKYGKASIWELGYISFNIEDGKWYNSTSVSSDKDLEEFSKSFEGLKSVVDRLKHIIKYDTIENIEMFIKQDLNHVEQEIDEIEVRIKGPKYHLKNLCQLFRLMNSTENTGGHLIVDLIYTAHTQEVKFDILTKGYESKFLKSYGNNSIDSGILNIFDHETKKYDKKYLPIRKNIKMDI